MAAVVGEHSASESVSASQDLRVGCSCPPILLGSQNVVAQSSQLCHSGERKIFVGVQEHPWSLHEPFLPFLVLSDRVVNLLAVGSGVFPGSLQVRRSQARIPLEEIRLRCTLPTVTHEH